MHITMHSMYRLSLLLPKFNSHDRLWMFVKGYGSRLLGHMLVLSGYSGFLPHQWPPLAANIVVPQRNKLYNDCVGDNGSRAVVVVTKAGKLIFSFIGTLSSRKGKFDPIGIASDRQCWILTFDFDKNCIHIRNQEENSSALLITVIYTVHGLCMWTSRQPLCGWTHMNTKAFHW